MSITWRRKSSASLRGRWKELRPMIDPKPPPSRMARTSSKMAAVSFASPPEKMTMRRPLKALCTTWRTRSARGAVGVVELQDARNLAREPRRRGRQVAERRRLGVAARRERQLEVVARIVRSRIGGAGARRAVLEALIDGQDHEPAAAREAPVVHEARQVGQRARVVASVPAQDLPYSLAHGGQLS